MSILRHIDKWKKGGPFVPRSQRREPSPLSEIERQRIEQLRAEWDEKMKAEVEANLSSKHITGEDLSIRVGSPPVVEPAARLSGGACGDIEL